MEENKYLAAIRCRRLNGNVWEDCAMSLAKECALYMTVNGRALPGIICSPVDPEELITGRLITEGYIRDAAQLTAIRIDDGAMPERVTADVSAEEKPLDPVIAEPAAWDAEAIRKLRDYVLVEAPKHRGSHSTHSCTLMRAGAIICYREDIGRHNAIDRAVGWAARSGIRLGECVAFFSGRVSRDAVRKAAAAGMTVLCGKALPTAQAVALAREKRVVLLHCSDSRGLILF